MSGNTPAGVAEAARPGIVGARVQRREDPRLLTGRGSYTDDRKAAGAVHVAFCRSDRAHARIAGIDPAEACRAPGVLGVFTAADIDAVARPIRAESNMPDYRATDFVPLAREKVRYVGEPVAAVVAENRYLAEDAAALVSVDYDPLPDVADPEACPPTDRAAAPRGGRDQRHRGPGVRPGRCRIARWRAPRWSLRIGSASGARRLRRSRTAAISPSSTPAGSALTLLGSTQVPGLLRDALAEIFDLPGRRLRVVAPDVGGGFGGKASLYPEEVVVCALAMRLGRPVKWTGDRIEDLTATSQAFDEIVRARLALDADGTDPRARSRCHRRYRRLFDLSLDRVAGAGAGGEFPAGPLPDRELSRAGPRGRNLEGARPGRIAASAGRSRPSSWNG